ncbi:MAG TPA: glycosyltransferase family 4 protein [Kofleriaceae bacterium]
MRLALVTNSFPTLSETFIYNHAAGMRAAGFDVTVVAARPSTDTKYFADGGGVRYDGPIRQAVLTGDAMTSAARLASTIARSSRRHFAAWHTARARYGTSKRALRAFSLAAPLLDFDVVHFEYSGLALAWADALPLLAPAKLVVSCRGAAEQITPLVEPDRVGKLREMFSIVDRVHCVSDDMLATCVSYGLDPAKAFINRPAIDATRFQRREPYVARSTSPYRLLSTGRLHWKKGIEFGLLAVRALLDAGHDVHYEIVGSGHDEEHLRFSAHDLRLDDHVTFAGKRSSAEVREALERCDVYVLPSLSEGISNAALEAMAMGLPIVSTTAGGMAEAISDGVDGLLVPPRDARAMADAIARLLGSPALRLSLGAGARRKVEQAFSLDRQINTYVAEYNRLMACVPQ